MHRQQLLLSSILFLCATLMTPPAPSRASSFSENALEEAVVGGNTAFALKLYQELGTSAGNLFFSPYSISTALGMAYGGAREKTAREMREALHFPLEQALLHPAFGHISRDLAAAAHGDGQQLAIANGLCLTGGDVQDSFKTLLKDNYDAEIFRGNVGEINAWVKRKTEGKISEILTSLDANSVCVLLNAIYFKGLWESRFKKEQTHDAPFKVTARKLVTVAFMHQNSDFKILQKPDFQAALIPYRGNALSMIILLPQQVDGLAALERQVTAENLKQWMAELYGQVARQTELSVPKYRLESTCDLVAPCKKLGMKDAFDPAGAADFSGMGWPKGKLWISQIRHKAFVEVNEEGTEATAATIVGMRTMSAGRSPVFCADHPFLFLIRHNRTGSLLFMGRIADPKGA